MTITRPEFPSPVIVLDDFLPAADADRCFQECLDLEPAFGPASIHGASGPTVDPAVRANAAVRLDAVFGADRSRSAILTVAESRIRDHECRPIWHQGGLIFDIINFCTWQESALSRYGTGHFYGRHRDTLQSPDHPELFCRRIVTLVYYLNRVPRRFTGGALTLYDHRKQMSIEPRHNRAVVFPSFTFHEVKPVQLLDARWDSGRFSLNHWMGFK